MPPRRRKRNAPAASPSPQPSPDPEPEPEASPSQSNASRSASPQPEDDNDPPRFYNTTFTTYRVSPLYLGKQPLTPARLQILSRRLRDALVGDVVRGVQVGLVEGSDGGALGRTGALMAVEWRWVDAARILGSKRDRQGRSVELGGQDDFEEHEGEGRRVLCIELFYENARFSALLMPDFTDGEGTALDSTGSRAAWTWQQPGGEGEEVDQSAFLHLPLLLFRMPVPLKSVLISFLSSTFDCRISPLALGTRTLVSSWEAWLSDSKQTTSKDVLFTLGFHIEPPEPAPSKAPNPSDGEISKPAPPPQQGLKTLDIAVPAAEVHRFLRVGEATPTHKRKASAAITVLSDEQQSRRRRKLAGGKDEEGWAWRGSRDGAAERKHPFTEALAAYTWHHLGLDMFHPGVRVQRVACDAFALSDGRLKVFAPGAGADTGPAWRLVRDLTRRARGDLGWGSGVAIKVVAS